MNYNKTHFYPIVVLTFCTVILALELIQPSAAFGQDASEGYSRIQGVDKDKKKKPKSIQGLTTDFREEMRLFVQRISKFARGYNPNFIVIANGGLDLIGKRDEIDQRKTSPARAYIRSLDGIMQKGIFFSEETNEEPFGAPTDIFIQEKLIKLAEKAKNLGLRVFTLDFSKDIKSINKVEKLTNQRGFVSLVVESPAIDIQKLPSYPTPPFRENSESILALGMAKNYITITNSAPFGRQDIFALKMHETNYDMIAVEILHGRRPLSRRAVETLKFKKIGTRRLALAYMDIGLGASYHYYWKPGSRPGFPPWINEPEPNDPDRYRVEYWRQGWQNIIYGDTNSYTYGLIAQGFDGVILSGLDTYKYFEGE